MRQYRTNMSALVNQYDSSLTSLGYREPAAQRGAIESVRNFIAAGDYAPGDRLPAERALIRDLGMSRSTLRKALDALGT